MTKAQTIYRFTAMNQGTSLQDHPGLTHVDRKNRFFRFTSSIRSLPVNLMKKVNGFSWYLQNFLWARQNQLNRSLQDHG